MGLDINLITTVSEVNEDGVVEDVVKTVFNANITHNLIPMAKKTEVFNILWRNEENSFFFASDAIEPLEKSINDMVNNPLRFKKFDAENGWGTFDDFIPWLQNILRAFKKHPDAFIQAGR